MARIKFPLFVRVNAAQMVNDRLSILPLRQIISGRQECAAGGRGKAWFPLVARKFT
jgi:hypothetical protein